MVRLAADALRARPPIIAARARPLVWQRRTRPHASAHAHPLCLAPSLASRASPAAAWYRRPLTLVVLRADVYYNTVQERLVQPSVYFSFATSDGDQWQTYKDNLISLGVVRAAPHARATLAVCACVHARVCTRLSHVRALTCARRAAVVRRCFATHRTVHPSLHRFLQVLLIISLLFIGCNREKLFPPAEHRAEAVGNSSLSNRPGRTHVVPSQAYPNPHAVGGFSNPIGQQSAVGSVQMGTPSYGAQALPVAQPAIACGYAAQPVAYPDQPVAYPAQPAGGYPQAYPAQGMPVATAAYPGSYPGSYPPSSPSPSQSKDE
jgi:hypothetical protein